MCNNAPLIITVLNKFGRNTVYSAYQENQFQTYMLFSLFVCLYEDVKRMCLS